MALILFLAAFAFGYLAVDAIKLGRAAHGEVPYSVGAKARGENLAGVSLAEQRSRQAWHQRYGIGQAGGIAWVWLALAIGCLAAALMATIG